MNLLFDWPFTKCNLFLGIFRREYLYFWCRYGVQVCLCNSYLIVYNLKHMDISITLFVGFGGLEKGRLVFLMQLNLTSLTTEAVQGTSLALQGIDNIHGGDSLPLGMLSVGDSIPDDIFQENLEYTSGFFIDESRDTFHTTSAGQTADCWLGDTLDVITEYLAMTLGSSFSQTLASFTTSRHSEVFYSKTVEWMRLKGWKLTFYTKPCTGRQPGAWNKPRACAGGFSHLVCSFCRVVVSWLWELTAKSFLQWKIQKNNVILSDFPYFRTLKTPSRYLHFLRRYSTFSGFKGKPDQGLSDWAPAWPREMAHLPFSVPREAWRIESDQWEWGKWVAWPMREVSLLKGGWFKYFELFWGFILFLYSYRFCTVLY